jgi:hypothetical protein
MIDDSLDVFEKLCARAAVITNWSTGEQSVVSREKIEALRVLVDLAWARNLLQSDKFEQAAKQIERLDIFPVSRELVPEYEGYSGTHAKSSNQSIAPPSRGVTGAVRVPEAGRGAARPEGEDASPR